MGETLWNTYLDSPLYNRGVGSTLFKNPVLWALLEKIDDLLGNPENKVVLDVGCGSGVKSLLMALKGAKVRGFDIDPKAISNCNKNLRKLRGAVDAKFFILNVQGALPAEYYGNVDFILCNQVIEHIEDYEKTIDEMVRALKPNGKILITTPNRLTHKPEPGEKVYGEKLHGHHHAFTREDLRKALAGKKDVAIEEITTHNVAPPLAIKLSYAIFVGVDSLHRLTQKVDEKRGTRLETLFLAAAKPFVVLCNSLLYPSILSSYLRKARKMTTTEALYI